MKKKSLSSFGDKSTVEVIGVSRDYIETRVSNIFTTIFASEFGAVYKRFKTLLVLGGILRTIGNPSSGLFLETAFNASFVHQKNCQKMSKSPKRRSRLNLKSKRASSAHRGLADSISHSCWSHATLVVLKKHRTSLILSHKPSSIEAAILDRSENRNPANFIEQISQVFEFLLI